MRDTHTIITEELLRAGAGSTGQWTQKQLELLGAGRANNKGWKRRIIGTTITIDAAEEFIRLKGSSKAQRNMKRKADQKQQRDLAKELDVALAEAAYWKRRYREVVQELEGTRMDHELQAITVAGGRA
jgi:hypothetical protein